MNIAIAGIHTGIGKTVCSAILCQALGFAYWKPVQAGELEHTDSHCIKELVPGCIIHPEKYRLQNPLSPHHAAALEGMQIRKEDFSLPQTHHPLLVETAGGLMSPLSAGFLNIDLIVHLDLPVVLISNNYLGSINHTLLSCSVLQSRKLKVLGLVFVGNAYPEGENLIMEQTKLPRLFSVPWFEQTNHQTILNFTANHLINL